MMTLYNITLSRKALVHRYDKKNVLIGIEEITHEETLTALPAITVDNYRRDLGNSVLKIEPYISNARSKGSRYTTPVSCGKPRSTVTFVKKTSKSASTASNVTPTDNVFADVVNAMIQEEK